ncbi:hypothetical protein BH24ACT12_BH24ACT12_11660 [soil metagenome]
MSVADTRDLPEPPDDFNAIFGGSPGGRTSFDSSPAGRTPPQDHAAEQSVLGAVLLSKDAIADVLEAITGTDFYRPAHESIYDAVIDLYGRGEPADAVTVAAELSRRGDLAKVGGAPYLHDLVSGVPIAANAGYYAEIVREKAILRRLVDAGTKIAPLGYAGAGQVDDTVDRAQAEIFSVTERRASEDYLPLSEIMAGTLDEIEAISAHDGGMSGVPTGFADLDELTNGLQGGQMVIVAARPALGKALALDTPLPTPEGWTTMGEVAVGDRLLGADGRAIRVVAATDVMRGRSCYEVSFSDGARIVADAEHQWLTETRAVRKARAEVSASRHATTTRPLIGSVVTTEQLAATVRVGTDQRLNHSVVNAAPVTLPDADLLVAPYTLGVWLGDGHTASARFTSADPEIASLVELDGYVVGHAGRLLYHVGLPVQPVLQRSCEVCADCGEPFSGIRRCARCHAHHGTVQARLRTIGVLGDKHIPAAYLRASERQRRALLAGLLDTDGTVTNCGSVQFAVCDHGLADDTYELIVSLGYKCSRTTKRVGGRDEAHSTCHILDFTCTDDVFGLTRKVSAHRARRPVTLARIGKRLIRSVDRVDSVPVRCVQVDNTDQLYLAGRSMVPTHNSTLGLDFCRAASIKHGMASAIFSLEMSRNEITMKLLAAEARIALNHMRNGHMTNDDWSRLARKMGEVSSAPLFIDDSPNLTMMEIRAKARRLKQRHDLKLVVVDYLQLLSSGKKVESRQLEVSEFSRQMKLLAKELDVPIVAISQLNRGAEQRTDKRPLLSDLRESGCLTADTRLLRADTGAEISLGELLARNIRDIPVWTLDDRLKLVPRTLTHAFPSGVKETFRVRTASGRTVDATANHPFLTYDGWQPLGELAVGSRVGVLCHVPSPLATTSWDDDEVVLLAHLLGDGSFVRRQPMDLSGLRSHEKFVPDGVFGLPKHQVGLFLRHLWATDGSVRWDATAGQGRIHFESTSRRLVDAVARLLLRFNIVSRIKKATTAGYRDGWHLLICGADNQKRFCTEVGVHGLRGRRTQEVLLRLEKVTVNTDLDTVPVQVWDRVRTVLHDQQHAPSRSRLSKVATILDADLEVSATNDVFWDQIVEVEPLGERDVYDATVLGHHNFVANGIALHNSLEQDADMVILLHREDAYEKESTRPGEADLIVAKHRAGPTDTIVVAFQGHYSRFVDMQQS